MRSKRKRQKKRKKRSNAMVSYIPNLYLRCSKLARAKTSRDAAAS